ncbi:hypothetical protein [Clostridium vincentii]|uniref:Uncharacterized protein n=1 Tax=Clostridium vincentii TaxID=52704 RepID=A0A2T0BL16_9CLOT|nr:hypothetical protein [Clostridium vincentii]PRR84533.1 hypothetical protein CLVI_00560 [Clostridium vincentii]
MYYKIKYKLRNNHLKNINLCDYIEELGRGVENYNIRCANSKNIKEIIDMAISRDFIEITLTSNKILKHPSLALRIFSEYLVKKMGFNRLLTTSIPAKLFRSVQILNV